MNCKIEGCELIGNSGSGFCANHYYHYKKGNMDIDGNWLKPQTRTRVFAKKCIVKECHADSIVKGYCLEHYRHQMLCLDIEKTSGSNLKQIELMNLTKIIPEIKIHTKCIPEYELKELPVLETQVNIIKNENDCKMPECGKKISAKGFCVNHYFHYKTKKLDFAGNWLREKRPAQSKICRVVGCVDKSLGKSLCDKHFKLVKRGQIIIKGFDLSGYKKCKVENCNRILETKGFCGSHHFRYKEGFIDIDGKQLKEHIRDRNELDIETCLVGGCNDKHLSKGLCQKHYSVYLRRYNEEWLRQKFFSNKDFVCTECGRPYLFCQMDFHHQRDKTLLIGEQLNSSTFTERQEIIDELNKGVWLCSRCHMSLHHNYNLTFYEDKLDKQRGVNIDRAYRLIMQKYGYNCKCCGDILLSKEIEFHHRDPNEKEYNLAGEIGWQKFETLCLEIDKCDILCRNCHRLTHYVEFGEAGFTLDYFIRLFKLNNILT